MSPLLPPERLSPETLAQWRRRADAEGRVGPGVFHAVADALEAAESHWQMAHVDHIEAERRAESAESLVRTLGAFVEDARRSHYDCEDCWYSCPKAPEGSCNDTKGDECDCGADEWNARVDAALTQFQEFLTHQEAESDGP